MKALLVLLAACGGAQSPARPASPTLVVKDAGAEPRRIVRYEPPPNADAHAEFHFTLTVTRSFTNTVLENAANSVTFPEFEIAQHWHVTEVLPDGSARIRIDNDAVRTGAVTDPKTQKAVDQAANFLEHHSGSFRLLPDGTHTEQQIPDAKIPLDTDVSMIFPPTPIGLGAEWTVTQTPTLAGARWVVTTTYHLRALDDTSASVEVETSGVAPEQALTVDPNNSTTLTEGKLTGSAQFLIPLRTLIPTGGGHLDTTTAYQLVRNHLRIETATHIEQASQIRPAP